MPDLILNADEIVELVNESLRHRGIDVVESFIDHSGKKGNEEYKLTVILGQLPVSPDQCNVEVDRDIFKQILNASAPEEEEYVEMEIDTVAAAAESKRKSAGRRRNTR